MLELLEAANKMSPLGLAVMLALIIYMQVRNKKAVREVSDNHLSGLPEMSADIRKLVTLAEAEQGLNRTMNDNLVSIKTLVEKL